MVRNTTGGKAYKKSKSGNVRRKSKNPDVPVDTTTGIDHYANVIKRLGNNRLLVKLDNGNEVQAVIPGRFMKKVWFNPGDYIHVRCEGTDGNEYYDIIQKIMNPNEQANAQMSLGKRETGEEDFFRPDIIEESDEEEYVNNNDNDDEETDNLGNKVAKQKPNIVLNKENVSAVKHARKLKEKERDIKRRADADNDDFDGRPISVVTNEVVTPVKVTTQVVTPVKVNKNITVNNNNIDSSDSETESTNSTATTNSTDSSDEE